MIPHNKLTLGKDEKDNIVKVISSGWIAQGSEVERFENEVCKFLKLPKAHAVAVSSCSMAMFVALTVLGVKNKTIGMPVYVSRVLRGAAFSAGGKERLYDINKNDPNINMNEVLKNPPNILLVPHMYGIPVDLSHYRKSIVIENCAHSLGATVNKLQTGTQCDLGVLSFQATKLISSGGMGGMIVSKNKAFIKKARNYRDFDESRKHEPNLNVKMSDVSASFGRAQLKKLKSFLGKRDKIFKIYDDAGLNLLGNKLSKTINPVRYRAVLKTKNPKRIINHLKSKGVQSIVPIEKWELLSKNKKYKNAIEMTNSTISLPIYPSLSLKDAKIIAEIVSNI